MWKMTFRFNDEKAHAFGTSAQACYDVVDKLFARYGIKPTSQGVYEASDNQNSFTAFAVAHKLPYTDWFLLVIEQWLFYENDNEPEDCLESYYRVKENKW